MKSIRPLLSLAASAALAIAAPTMLHAQDSSPAPSSGTSETDIFDAIKRGADKLQKQAKDTRELGPKVKLLEERQNEFYKREMETDHRLETMVSKQQEEILHLTHELERIEAALKGAHPSASPAADESPKPVAPLPMTEPPVKATPSPEPSPSAS